MSDLFTTLPAALLLFILVFLGLFFALLPLFIWMGITQTNKLLKETKQLITEQTNAIIASRIHIGKIHDNLHYIAEIKRIERGE